MVKEVSVEEQTEEMLETIEQKEPEKKSEKELKFEKLHKVKAEEEVLLSAWRKTFDDDLTESDCYFEMDNYVKMVAEGISTGCIIESSAGLGKSHRTTSILNKMNVDYGYIDSYSSPASFYVWLYKNKDNIVVIDDIPNLFHDKRALSYLKAALWAVQSQRIVHNLTQKPLIDEFGENVPDNFEVTGGLIMLTNILPIKNPHVQAVLSRVNYTKLEIPIEERLRIIEAIAKKKYDELNESERLEVVDFIKKNTTDEMRDINLRTLFKLFHFRQFTKREKAGELWKRLGNHLFKKDDTPILVEELEKRTDLTPDQKVDKFMELTGKSRATYYRLKQKAE